MKQWEVDFLEDYREAGRRWVAYAVLAASGLYLAVAAIVVLTEPHTALVIWVRFVIVVLLLISAGTLLFARTISGAAYVFVTAAGSVIGLGGIVVLFILPHSHELERVVNASPAFMFGLLIHYAFLRLPVGVAALIGVTMSAAAARWVPMVSGGSEQLRTALFLAFANVFGIVLCFLVESRERALYFQRRRSEESEGRARLGRAEAEQAEQQKTRLIAAVSHDLRQPMTAAVAYIDVLRNRLERDDVEGARTSAERAQAALSSLGATLDHLLTAARYSSGTEAIRIESVTLSALLKDLYETHIGEAEKNGVRLRFRLPRRAVLLQTDLRSIQRVLGNLISNAVKFTEARHGSRAEVLVAARLRGARCRIDVIDTGSGIPESAREEIWKPYVQLSNAERDRARGLGLGLFLVRQIVEQLPDHSLEMASHPGRGSRFTVHVPGIAFREGVSVRPKDSRPSMPAEMPLLQGAYVWVIEDDQDARLSIEDLLGEWGMVVNAGASLAEALVGHADSERAVDAVVCDYRLGGGVTGIEVLSELERRLGYSPGAVLITGEADPAPLVARVVPGTVILHKPFAPGALAAPLIEAVRRARAREEC